MTIHVDDQTSVDIICPQALAIMVGFSKLIKNQTRIFYATSVLVLVYLCLSWSVTQRNYKWIGEEFKLRTIQHAGINSSKEYMSIKRPASNKQPIRNGTLVAKDTLEHIKLLSSYGEMVKMIGHSELPLTINSGYLMENPTLCSSVTNLSLVIVVHTSTGHFRRRHVIRQTWANGTFIRELGTLRIVFMVGRPINGDIQRDLVSELDTYGDILQGDFIDTYHNLSHKGVMGFKWLTERCKNAKFVVKTDDDVTLDSYQLLTDIRKRLVNAQKTILCDNKPASRSQIIRNPKEKWYLEERYLSGLELYPKYCRGYFVAFSSDMIPYLYEAAKSTPVLWVDDAYLYGILANRVPGLNRVHLDEDKLTVYPKTFQSCLSSKKKCSFLAVGQCSVDLQLEGWTYIKGQYTF